MQINLRDYQYVDYPRFPVGSPPKNLGIYFLGLQEMVKRGAVEMMTGYTL